MKKLFLIITLFSLFPLTMISQTQLTNCGRIVKYVSKGATNNDKTIRFFLNDGSYRDFNASVVDSITTDNFNSNIWSNGTKESLSLNCVDSIWHMQPTLRFSSPELDFGKVMLGSTKYLKVNVTNTGQFKETFKLNIDEGFFVDGISDGSEIIIEPGVSLNIKIAYAPESTTTSNGYGTFESSAINDGVFQIALTGEGVEEEKDEEDVELITSQDISIELSEDVDESFLSECKLVNAYGEYSFSNQENMPRHIKKNGYGTGDVAEFRFDNTILSQTNLMINTMMYKDYPFMWQIHVPGMENQPINAESTVLAMLMTMPQLVTTDVEEFNNLTAAIRQLDAFHDLVAEVGLILGFADRNHICPDISNINLTPVITALIRGAISNDNLSMNGLSLKNIKRIEAETGDSIQFKVVNDSRRMIHIYPRRAIMDPANFTISQQEDITWTVSEFLNALEEENEKGKDGLIQFEEGDQELIDETREFLKDADLEGLHIPFGLPYILEPPKASYWKIVKEGFYDIVGIEKHEESIYHNESELYQVSVEKADKMYVDIFGLGYDRNNQLSTMSNKDGLRFIGAAIHSMYKDIFLPLVDLGNGIIEVERARGFDDYKYDLRYGKRKYPTWALIQKLAYNWEYGKNGQTNTQKLVEYAKNKDVWGIVSHISLFLYDEILGTADQDAGKKDTYFNLIYNIYKNVSGNKSISKKTRDEFKKACNNLTFLKKADFIGKVTDVAEDVLDLSATVEAYVKDEPMTTFIVNRKEKSEITIHTPEADQNGKHIARVPADGKMYFEWDFYRGDVFGANISFDIRLYVEYAHTCKEFDIVKGTKESYQKEDGTRIFFATADLSTIPNINKAESVNYRIIIRHDLNQEMIYDQTDLYPLYTISPADNYNYIDLGLPSGTLWASHNLGAEKTSGYGYYYAWADTKGSHDGKGSFSWKTYKYCNGTSNSLKKYCTKKEYGANGFTDRLTELEDMDDPAFNTNIFMCRTPNVEEWKELIDYCTWMWFSDHVVVRSNQNGNVITLPMAGYIEGLNTYDEQEYGYYWTTSLDKESPDDAWFIYIGGKERPRLGYYRSIGRSIRPIIHVIKEPEEGSSDTTQNSPLRNNGEFLVEKISAGGNIVKLVSHSAVANCQ